MYQPDIKDKLIKFLNDPNVQALLSLSGDVIGVINPIGGAAISIFKEIASLSDEIRFSYLIKGLASGIDQEKFTNELVNYVKVSEDNAWHVVNSLRKAMLTDSTIACTLMGRILADHAKDKRPYDKYDVIVVHALDSATDDDLLDFRKMITTATSDGFIATGHGYDECETWCISNRLCKEVKALEVSLGAVAMSPGISMGKSAERLVEYLEEIKGVFRWED